MWHEDVTTLLHLVNANSLNLVTLIVSLNLCMNTKIAPKAFAGNGWPMCGWSHITRILFLENTLLLRFLRIIFQFFKGQKLCTVFQDCNINQILMLGVLFYCNTHGSLFSWEPNMIIDFKAFQSCRTLSRASWAKRGGSRSWSGISESETEERRILIYYARCILKMC